MDEGFDFGDDSDSEQELNTFEEKKVQSPEDDDYDSDCTEADGLEEDDSLNLVIPYILKGDLEKILKS